MASEDCKVAFKTRAALNDMSDADVNKLLKYIEDRKDDPDFKQRLNDEADEWSRQAALEKNRTRLQLAARYKLQQGHVEPNMATIDAGKASMFDVTKAYLVSTGKRIKGAYDSVDARMRASAATYGTNEPMQGLHALLGPQFASSFKDTGFNRLVAHEMGGEATGNAQAKGVSDLFKSLYTKAITRANATGADIKELDNYIFAQRHDPYRLSNAGFDQWYADIAPKLDAKTYEGGPYRFDKEAGIYRSNYDPKPFLKNVYDNILQGTHDQPWADTHTGGAMGMGKAMSQHRVLHFKDADSFLEYDKSYGSNGDVMGNVMGQLHRLHSQATLMERLGPNPETWFAQAVQDAQTASRQHGKLFTPADEVQLRNYMDVVTGASHKIASQRVAHYASVFRAVINMAHLGTSTISSFGDVNNMAMILHSAGMPAFGSYMEAGRNFAKYLGESIANVPRNITGQAVPRSAEYMQIAKALSSGLDGAMHANAGRFMPHEDFSGTVARAQGNFFKLNGQGAWDDDMKFGTQKALATLYAGMKDTPFSDLSRNTQTTLTRAGFEAKDWDALRKTEVTTVDGHDHIFPDKVQDKELSEKYNAHLLAMAETTVPLPGAREQAWMSQKFQRGDAVDEVLRSMFMFKSFPVSLMSKMWPRVAEMGLPGWAMATVGGIPLGYAALAMKNVIVGKEPPELNAQTTLASAIQGGAASMLGDIVMHKFDAQHSLMDFVAGPAGATANDVTEALAGEDKAPQLIQAVARNTPYANLWFTKGAFNYLLVDQLQEAVNPGYLKRMEFRAQNKYNEQYWLPPSDFPVQH